MMKRVRLCRYGLCLACYVGISFAGIPRVQADLVLDEVTYGGVVDKNAGSGLGVKQELLHLQGKHGGQSGSVFWNGSMEDRDGDAGVSSRLVGFSDLWQLGYSSSDFKLFLDLNQGQGLTSIDAVTLRFYDGSNSSQPVFSITGTGFQNLAGAQGNSNWDHYFSVRFSPSHATDFDDPSHANWLVGIDVQGMTAASGADVFGVAQSVPEPTAIVLWGLGGVTGLALAWFGRRRRRAQK